MTSDQVRPGDVLYLVPTLPSAPTAAYRCPRVRVLAVGYGEATVELPDGGRVTTSPANLTRRLATEEPRQPRPARRPVLDLPPDMEEVPLW